MFFSLNQLPLDRDEFIFQPMGGPYTKGAITINNPPNAITVSPVFLRSRFSLEEHIAYIRENNVDKAIVIAEDIHFLKQCPSIECLTVYPAVSAEDFD